MLVEKVIGNLFEAPGAPPESDVDWVDFRWDECERRAHHKQSRGGIELRILFPIGQVVRHGDRLATNSNALRPLAVWVLPVELLVVRTPSRELLATLAYQLGNLHVPIELSAGEIATPPDGPVEAVIALLGLEAVRETRRFAPLSINLPAPTIGRAFEIVRGG